MLYTIENECLQVSVSTHGAQLQSIKDRSGREYLWQADPKYWNEKAPVLFPFIGRLEGKQYCLDGQTYSMGLHGFAAGSEFTPVHRTGDCVVLALSDTAETRAVYPCAFVLEITYRLAGNTLLVENRVKNPGESTIHFALGGHPGFRVPLAEGERFEDCYLEFDREAQPQRIGFTEDTVLVSGVNTAYPLEGGRRISLRHELFDGDAIILRDVARQVMLKSEKSSPSLTVSYPDMPYLGFWHWPRTDAPYVCIEPWTSLPGRSAVTEDIALREDFIHLEPGKTYENIWTVSLNA